LHSYTKASTQTEPEVCGEKDPVTANGERYHRGERISTGFVESTANQVVSQRMVKKQQMQWAKSGAHLLLQIRTRVLNDDWETQFREWYPGFRSHTQRLAAGVVLSRDVDTIQ
jgi:hypothetical protein